MEQFSQKVEGMYWISTPKIMNLFHYAYFHDVLLILLVDRDHNNISACLNLI